MKIKSESANNQTVVIPTIDPKCGGGVHTVTEFTKRLFQSADYHPKVIYNSIDWKKGRTISDLLAGRLSVPTYEKINKSTTKVEIGRILPESEVLGYLLNSQEWNRHMDESNPILGVGGTCLPCFPAAIHGRNYDCWIGTTLVDERQYQITHLPTPLRLRYSVERPFLEWMERYVLKRANDIYVQSNYTKQILEKTYDISSNAISKVPFPIDADQYSPPDHRDSSKDLLFVGRLNDPRKRIDILIEAFVLLLHSHPDARLHLVGEPPDDNIQSLIKSFGVQSNIETPGRVDDLVELYQKSSIFVLSSDQEGLGIAGLEAMSTGLPVVSTRCGGPEEYITDGWNGRLVPKASPKIFAEAVDEILNDNELLQQMRRNSRKKIVQEYNTERVKHEFMKKIRAQ